jgi:hypothetical protein
MLLKLIIPATNIGAAVKHTPENTFTGLEALRLVNINIVDQPV